MSVSLDIARAQLAVTHDALPTDAAHAARASLADGLAVMLGAAAREPAVEAFHAHAVAAGGDAATLLGGGRATASMAALANGALMHALDFEDTYEPAGLHPNAAVIPAALALAEANDASLGALLTAIAVGADLACRIGDALESDPAERHWYHPPMIGAAGAALGASHLLGLTPLQAVSALSLTQTQFALTDALKRSPGSALRAVRDGFAARAAVEAVLLAGAGVVGTADPLNETGGLIHTLTGHTANGRAFADCDEAFRGAAVAFKRWPCCRGTHEAIQLGLELRSNGIQPDEIARIGFNEVPPNAMLFEPQANRQAPEQAIDAKFSVPYTFAVALSSGEVTLGSFGEDVLQDAAIRAVAALVELDSCEPEQTRTALIAWRDGRIETRPLPTLTPLQAGTTPFAELKAKFTGCLAQTPAATHSLNTLMQLEHLPPDTPVRDFIRALLP